MSESSHTPPSILAVNQPDRETRPHQNKRPSLLILTGVTLGGTTIGLALGHYAALLYSWIGGTPEGVSAVATLMIAGFTWSLVRANATSARSAEETLRHLKESYEKELRGYVFFERPLREYEPTGYSMRFTNFGQTPVKNLNIVAYISDDGVSTEWKVTREIAIAIGPHASVDIHLELPFEARKMPSGWYFHGTVTYTDAFTEQRWTRFRYQWKAEWNDWINCADGNDWK